MAHIVFGLASVELRGEDFKMKFPLNVIGFIFLCAGDIGVALVFFWLGWMASE